MAEASRLTRRQLIVAGGGAVASLFAWPAISRAAGSPAPAASADVPGYVSRPDLKPPRIAIAAPADGVAPGYVFLAPFDISVASTTYSSTPASESHSGPLIVDDTGEPVWFLPLDAVTATDVRVQEHRGRPVVTWYEGTVLGAYGGDYVVFDPTYHEVARVRAAGGRHGDLHEFLLTPQGTALISIYREIGADLSPVGGPVDGRLVEGIVQEVDVKSGRLLFEWRSSDHVPLEESYRTSETPAGNVDYFHLNAIEIDADGDLLVSSRHTSTVYKVDRRSGAVIWRLGGKRSDFAFDEPAAFSFQHDVRRHADGTLTLFDNRATDPGPDVASRGLRIALDMKRMRASLVREYRTTTDRAGWAMGNVQHLDDGGVLVGWGTDGSFSEFSAAGRLRFDARFADGSVGYRAFRFPWTGHPAGLPATAARRNPDGTTTVYASWNGATEVDSWQVRTGSSPDRLRVTATSPRLGFETAVTVPATSGYVSITPLDKAGKALCQVPPLSI